MSAARARYGGLSCSAQEPRGSASRFCRAAVSASYERRSGGCTGSSMSRGDTVIRAASRSRLSAYRDFDFYDDHDDCLCAQPQDSPAPAAARGACRSTPKE